MKYNLNGMQLHRFIRKYIEIKNDKRIFLKILRILIVNLNLKSRDLICLSMVEEYHISGHCLLVSAILQ